MQAFDLAKSLDELIKPTDPPKGSALKNTSGAPNPVSLESILPRLSPEGQAWLNGLNRFCRRAVEHDLRAVGPDLIVKKLGVPARHPAKARTRLRSVR